MNSSRRAGMLGSARCRSTTRSPARAPTRRSPSPKTTIFIGGNGNLRLGMAELIAAPPGVEVSRADALIARLERLPFTRKHWLVAAVLCTATFFDGYDNLMITATLPLIVASLGLSLAEAGVLITAPFWGQAIGAPLSGILAERWGRRAAVLVLWVVV